MTPEFKAKVNLFLPWRIGNMNGVYIAEAQDKILVFQDPQAHPDAIAFAVHAANCHNDLVTALEWAVNGIDQLYPFVKNMEDLLKVKDVLAKAKGETADPSKISGVWA